MKALVSIIIPVYNTDEFLEECLDSVINQTYSKLEIIAVNDGSTDRSLEILKGYANKNKNFKIINQKNSGPSIARNQGIQMAKGKYIYFLDSDDYILPNTFEDLIKVMERNNLDLLRFGAEAFIDNVKVNKNLNKYDFTNDFDPEKVYKKNEFLRKSLKTFTSSPVLYIVKKDLLIKNNIMFKPNIVHEDDLFTLELFLNINAAMYQPILYYKRRYRDESITITKNKAKLRKSFDSRIIIYNELVKLLEEYQEKNEIDLIKMKMRTVLATLIYSDIKDKKHKKKQIKNLKNLKKYDYVYFTIKGTLRKYLLPLKNLIENYR